MSLHPEIIPIFPLHGTILLPNTILPLHIFEPRYRQMIDDAMEQEQVIGMIQPRDSEREAIYEVGCLGKIEQFQQLPNENYLIRLNGLQRFFVQQELEVSTLYRQVRVDYKEFNEDLSEEKQELHAPGRLYESFERYADKRGISVEWDKLKTIPIPYLVNILCMNLDFTSMEKQALLESPSLKIRWENLVTLIDMAIADNTDQHMLSECVN